MVVHSTRDREICTSHATAAEQCYITFIAVFLNDAHSVIYLWFGWWPEQKNALLRKKNAFTLTALSR